LRTVERQQRKDFLHRIVTGDEKWIFYDNLKKKKYYAKPGQSLSSTLTSTPRPNIHGSKIMLCIWWNPKGLVYYMLKPGDSITGERYQLQLIRLSALREKWPEYEQRYDKVILLHDNARPHIAKVVKKYLETLKWMFYRTRRILLLLITGCSEGMQHDLTVTGSLLSQKSKIGSKIGSPRKTSHFFRDGIRKLPEMGKSSRQRWTIL